MRGIVLAMVLFMQGSKLVDDVSASRQYMLVGSLLAIS